MAACKECGEIYGVFDLKDGVCKKCRGVEEEVVVKVNKELNSEEKEETSNLIECRICHNKISKNAVSCPHCGEPFKARYQKDTNNGGSVFVSLIVYGIVIWIAYSFFSCDREKTSTSTSTGTVNTISTQSADDCYILVEKWSDCINRSYRGQACLPGTDIVLPDRCNKPKYLNSVR